MSHFRRAHRRDVRRDGERRAKPDAKPIVRTTVFADRETRPGWRFRVETLTRKGLDPCVRIETISPERTSYVLIFRADVPSVVAACDAASKNLPYGTEVEAGAIPLPDGARFVVTARHEPNRLPVVSFQLVAANGERRGRAKEFIGDDIEAIRLACASICEVEP